MNVLGFGDYVFRIADFRSNSDGNFKTFVCQTQEEFKKKLVELTNHGEIQTFSVFEWKLKRVPKPLMHLRFLPIGWHLYHEYVEIRVKDKQGAVHLVTIEKIPQGIP